MRMGVKVRKLKKGAEIYIDHRVAQIWGVKSLDLLTNPSLLEDMFKQICKDLGLNVINNFFHKFKPAGISLVFILSQSHLAVHTWPENSYIHIDIFTCSKVAKLNFLKRILRKHILASKYRAGKLVY